MRKLLKNSNASAIPIILYFLAIFVCGALYTLFFIEVGYPTFDSYIPASDSKLLIMTGLYSIPLIVLVVGLVALIKAGLKKSEVYVQ